ISAPTAQSAIAFDSSAFLIAWNRNVTYSTGSLVTARIGESGGPFDQRVIPLPSPVNIFPVAARAVWTGLEVLVVYTFDAVSNVQFFIVPRAMGLAHFDHANHLLTQSSPTTFDAAGIGSRRIDAVVVSNRVTYAWLDANNNVSVAQTALDGSTLRAPRVIVK